MAPRLCGGADSGFRLRPEILRSAEISPDQVTWAKICLCWEFSSLVIWYREPRSGDTTTDSLKCSPLAYYPDTQRLSLNIIKSHCAAPQGRRYKLPLFPKEELFKLNQAWKQNCGWVSSRSRIQPCSCDEPVTKMTLRFSINNSWYIHDLSWAAEVDLVLGGFSSRCWGKRNHSSDGTGKDNRFWSLAT